MNGERKKRWLTVGSYVVAALGPVLALPPAFVEALQLAVSTLGM